VLVKAAPRAVGEEKADTVGEIAMEEEKLRRTADWLRSVLSHEILAPVEKFELSDIGQDHYRLSFEMNGAEKVFPMAGTYVEGVADGNERIQAQIKGMLLELARK
jgi:hypothetical protein